MHRKVFILLLILTGFFSTVTFSQQLLAPFKPNVIPFEEIPKSKIVDEKTFVYEETRYVYKDPEGNWEIIERPAGIYSHWFTPLENQNETGAFRIDFYKDSKRINTIDLVKSNPYSKENLKSNVGYVPSMRAYSKVWESDQNYIIVDHVFIREDTVYHFTNEVHTLVVFDNAGKEITRLSQISGVVADADVTHRGKYLSYIKTQHESDQSILIIYDLIGKKEIFNSSKTDKPFYTSNIETLSVDEKSDAPYLERDNSYLMLSTTPVKKYLGETCSLFPGYIDIENRIMYLGCFSAEAWQQYSWPQGHYGVLGGLKSKGIKF